MKKLITAGILTLALSSAAIADEPAVLATVNGKDVTKAEIEKALSTMTTEQLTGKAAYEKLPVDFRKAFVEKYVEKMLIIDAAKKAGLQNDPEVKQKLKDAEEFLIQQKFLTDLVAKQKSEEKLKKIYDEKIASKQGAEEARALHILVKTEDEAKKIREDLIKAGSTDAAFEKIAKEKSIDPGAKVSGGDLGYFTSDQMVPDFSKAVFSLKKGEISQPIKTQFGWHIAKLLDKRKKQAPTYAQSKPAVENQLATQIIEDEVKKLKSSANIKYYGDIAAVPAKPAQAPITKNVDNKVVTTSNINKNVDTQPAAK